MREALSRDRPDVITQAAAPAYSASLRARLGVWSHERKLPPTGSADDTSPRKGRPSRRPQFREKTESPPPLGGGLGRGCERKL